jgi:hypothetical protein
MVNNTGIIRLCILAKSVRAVRIPTRKTIPLLGRILKISTMYIAARRIKVETTEGQGRPAGSISGDEIDHINVIKKEILEPTLFLST